MRKSALTWLALCPMVTTACATQNAAVHTAAVPATHSFAGTILSLRTVAISGVQEPWRAALLTDASATTTPNDAPLTEFIVRADNGTTLSIVQPNQAAFRQGDRVTIQQDNRTRLLPSS